MVDHLRRIAEGVGALAQAFAGDPFVFAIYASALTITVVGAHFAQHEKFSYLVRLVLLSWVLTKLVRVALGSADWGYLLIDGALMVEFLRQWRATGLKLFRTMGVIYSAFIVLHFYGMLFDFSGDYFGAARSDTWVEAFWRNRVFDLGLLTMWAWGAQQLLLRFNADYRERMFADIADDDDTPSLRRCAVRIRARAARWMTSISADMRRRPARNTSRPHSQSPGAQR